VSTSGKERPAALLVVARSSGLALGGAKYSPDEASAIFDQKQRIVDMNSGPHLDLGQLCSELGQLVPVEESLQVGEGLLKVECHVVGALATDDGVRDY
jgi:hypothetical protein